MVLEAAFKSTASLCSLPGSVHVQQAATRRTAPWVDSHVKARRIRGLPQLEILGNFDALTIARCTYIPTVMVRTLAYTK